MLVGADEDTLRELLLKAVDRCPDVVDDIEVTFKARAAKARTYNNEVARASAIMHSLDNQWDDQADGADDVSRPVSNFSELTRS
jgi:hypothetical protein